MSSGHRCTHDQPHIAVVHAACDGTKKVTCTRTTYTQHLTSTNGLYFWFSLYLSTFGSSARVKFRPCAPVYESENGSKIRDEEQACPKKKRFGWVVFNGRIHGGLRALFILSVGQHGLFIRRFCMVVKPVTAAFEACEKACAFGRCCVYEFRGSFMGVHVKFGTRFSLFRA